MNKIPNENWQAHMLRELTEESTVIWVPAWIVRSVKGIGKFLGGLFVLGLFVSIPVMAFEVACLLLQIRGGVERDRYGKKAGKGALIQTDLCPSLGVSLDTTLFQELEMEEMNATAACPINSMVLGKIPVADDRQTLGFGEACDPSPTLSTAHHHAAAMSYDGYNQSTEDEVCNTLRTPEGGDNTAKVAMSYDGFNQSGAEETCHTLRTATGGESSDTTPKVAV